MWRSGTTESQTDEIIFREYWLSLSLVLLGHPVPNWWHLLYQKVLLDTKLKSARDARSKERARIAFPILQRSPVNRSLKFLIFFSCFRKLRKRAPWFQKPKCIIRQTYWMSGRGRRELRLDNAVVKLHIEVYAPANPASFLQYELWWRIL